MAKSEFSETQFVFGYLRELYDKLSVTSWSPYLKPYFTLPSTVKEKDISADFLIRYYSHSEYYQFKRSDRLKYKLGTVEKDAGVPHSFRTYYRFDIYNKKTVLKSGAVKIGQFEKLVDLAKNQNDRVYYCAPCFHTEKEFLHHFYDNEIIKNSVRIDCSQFDSPQFQAPNFDINDGNAHCMAYRVDKNHGYLCSKALETRVETKFSQFIDVPQPENFIEYMLNVSETESRLLILNRRRVNPIDESLDAIRTLTEHFLTEYNIIWLPIFEKPNG
jgi:hypothetical protein